MDFYYMSYDNTGFEVAKKDHVQTFSESADEVLEYLIQWGSIDWQTGNCDSFQIYNTEGELVFDSKTNESEIGGVA